MIHHTAIAVKDPDKAHEFYTKAMGFELVKIVKRLAPNGGWTKHIFYDTGNGELFAIFDLRGLEEAGVLDPDTWRGGMSKAAGLPYWVNHFAFGCDGADDLELKKKHWLDYGLNVAEVEHEWIHSIYTRDPDGTLVEFTYDTRPLNDGDRIEAEQLLVDNSPATQPEYEAKVFKSPVSLDVAAEQAV